MLAAVLVVTVTSIVASAAPATAAPLRTGDLIAFVRGGNLFVSADGGAPTQITTGGGYGWPRWAGAQRLGAISYVHNGDVFVANYSSRFGLTGTIRVTTGFNAGAASFSPNGLQIAFENGPQGNLYVADLTATPPTLTSIVGDPGNPPVVLPTPPGYSPLVNSPSVAWSPNGKWIAFTGGDCTGIFDHCLSTIEVATGIQQGIAAFSGGGDVREGAATVPAWSSDSKTLYWTQQNTDPLVNNGNTILPLRIFKYRVGTSTAPTQWGRNGDSEIAPFSAGGVRFLLTVPVGHRAWIAESEGGVRTLLFQGYEPSWVLN